LIAPKYRRNSSNKNGNSLQREGINRAGTGKVSMNTAKELCLAIVECLIGFENKRFLY